ncbi:hypothetical protein CEXT_53841 [Caerostris extrusa]|uniref:Uncharacterized protein n=1 Tax=Caerostris extrusa TaxID=172846 RepID=A0AAV4TTL5_CAEEX|nr:hypothetical protein CEXT_53841 [Caerostris extrusa]
MKLEYRNKEGYCRNNHLCEQKGKKEISEARKERRGALLESRAKLIRKRSSRLITRRFRKSFLPEKSRRRKVIILRDFRILSGCRKRPHNEDLFPQNHLLSRERREERRMKRRKKKKKTIKKYLRKNATLWRRLWLRVPSSKFLSPRDE